MEAENIISPVSFIDLFFLLPLFIIGLTASYTDIKYGKIFNGLIVLGLAYGAGLIFVLFLHNVFFAGGAENFIYLGKVCLNAALALVIGYFLWHQKLWSAGDAKLFAVYALLLPLKFYDYNYFNYFPSFNLLVNLFFPIIITLAFCALKDFLVFLYQYFAAKRFLLTRLSRQKCCQQAAGGIKSIIILFINFIFFATVFQMILSGLKILTGQEINPHPFLFYLILLLIMGRFNYWKTRIKWLSYFIYITSLIYITYLIIQSNFSAIWGLVKMALIFMVLINLTRRILDSYIDRKETAIIKLKDLYEGALVYKGDLEKIINSLGKENQELLSWISAEGLNKEQIGVIKDKMKDKSDEDIRVYKTFPFAPYMLLAAIFSILTRSSFLMFFKSLF